MRGSPNQKAPPGTHTCPAGALPAQGTTAAPGQVPTRDDAGAPSVASIGSGSPMGRPTSSVWSTTVSSV